MSSRLKPHGVSKHEGSHPPCVARIAVSCYCHQPLGVRDDLHSSLEARGSNINGSLPTYKNPKASIEDRVKDLLPRMTVQEKVSQL